MKNLKIRDNKSIYFAMKMLQQTALKCLIVVDKNGLYKGSLTDGDIRRFILSNKNINGNILEAYNRNSIKFKKSKINIAKIKKVFIEKNITLIPILDDNNKVVDIITNKILSDSYKRNSNNKKLNVPVVIMAGGKGTRLAPFTNVLPKPLIPIQDKTLIEMIIEKFTDFNIKEFYLTINFKSKIIKAFFQEAKKNYKTKFITEDKELGTAGALRFLKNKINKPFFVINCDTIIKENISDIYDHHIKNKNKITVVAAMTKSVIPFGICELKKNGDLKLIKEKPSNNHLINTGMYVVNPEVIKLIPVDKLFNFTDLIKVAKSKSLKIGVYPISEDAWIDVGQWDEYKNAINIL
jgi:dTDP-glucose pyrophosphorylase/predicted transcriptional regulator